jgi:methionyl-tRNA formyltransferase
MRVIFAGSPEFAAVSLKALIGARDRLGTQLVAVYSQPDRKAGRGQKLTPTPVKALALEHGLPVHTPLNFKSDAEGDAAFEVLSELQPDLIIVAAYGLILPQRVLDLPRLGCVNLHASLLPRWRGAAPIHRAVLAGDTQTGITLMQMALGLDTGDMLAKSTVPITADTHTPDLHDALAESAAELLIDSLPDLEALQAKAEPQDETQANYAHKLTKEEGLVDWSQPAEQVDRQIRGLAGWPVAYSDLQISDLQASDADSSAKSGGDQPVRVRLHRSLLSSVVSDLPAGTILSGGAEAVQVAAGDGGVVELHKLQLPGKKALSAAELQSGRALKGQFL